VNHRGICPSGWHLPSDDEWDALVTSVGGFSTAGKHLKSKEGWNSCGPTGSGKDYLCEDTHGFSALPGGCGYSSDGSFGSVGNRGYWWSSTEYDSYNAYYRNMFYYYESVVRLSIGKLYLLSVRCLQD